MTYAIGIAYLWGALDGQKNMNNNPKNRPYVDVLDVLKRCDLRPTRQRMALARLLSDAGDCHLTAEHLYDRAQKANIRVSLATIYNTLHQFTRAGMLREIVVNAGRSYFDTNTTDHHHFFFEDRAELEDIDGGDVVIASMPKPPKGTAVERIDVVIRVRNS
jgi:Fur family iron response transcriptional regulator